MNDLPTIMPPPGNGHSGMSEIHVAIIEDNGYVREAWSAMVAGDPGLKLCGAFASCEEAFRDASLAAADVVLMDIGLPGMSGIEGVAALKKQFPAALAVMCTVFEDDSNIFDALCAGAVGYVLKKSPHPQILQAIHDAASGGSPMSPAIARKVIQSFHRPSAPPGRHEPAALTEREQEVLDRLVQGKSYHAIAEELFLSVDGIRYHLRHIYEKLQVRTRAEAVARGLKTRIVQPPR
jgi:DNA-binding NarL/FixJ family response regulator